MNTEVFHGEGQFDPALIAKQKELDDIKKIDSFIIGLMTTLATGAIVLLFTRCPR